MSSMACQKFKAYVVGYVDHRSHSFFFGLSIALISDIVDYVEPSMLVVGSRGLGRLRG